MAITNVSFMSVPEKIEVAAKLNGHYSCIQWTSEQNYKLSAAAKKSGVVLTKRTKMIGRADIEYQNTKEYDKHEHTGNHLERVECSCKGVARNKYNGRMYLEVYPSNNSNQKAESQYFLNGRPISKEEALELMQPSKRESKASGLITIPLDGLELIG